MWSRSGGSIFEGEAAKPSHTSLILGAGPPRLLQLTLPWLCRFAGSPSSLQRPLVVKEHDRGFVRLRVVIRLGVQVSLRGTYLSDEESVPIGGCAGLGGNKPGDRSRKIPDLNFIIGQRPAVAQAREYRRRRCRSAVDAFGIRCSNAPRAWKKAVGKTQDVDG